MATPAVLRVVEREARVFSRLWRGVVFSLFLNPVLYLVALGLGLGGLVKEHTGNVEGLTYLAVRHARRADGRRDAGRGGGVDVAGARRREVGAVLSRDGRDVDHRRPGAVRLRAVDRAAGHARCGRVRHRRDGRWGRSRRRGGSSRSRSQGSARRRSRAPLCRVLGGPGQRRLVPADHAGRRAADLLVLRRVLSHLAAPGVAAEDRDDLAAVERDRAGPGRDHRHVRRRERLAPRGARRVHRGAGCGGEPAGSSEGSPRERET